MSTALTSIFGNEIKVRFQPRQPVRQITGYAGGHGATAMLMGSVGYPLIVTGTLRTSAGQTYANARTAMALLIEAIESWAWAPEQIFTYKGETYMYVVFDRLTLTDSDGKSFKYTSAGACIVNFVCTFRSLL
ncbi:MAG: hypothetical protein WC551_11240 [Patescibacteria group bacterium]